MNFARLKGSNPLVNWGQQAGGGIYLNNENPFQKGGFRSADQKTRAELTRIKEVVTTKGCEQFKGGAMLHYRLMAKGSVKQLKARSEVVRGLQRYLSRYLINNY